MMPNAKLSGYHTVFCHKLVVDMSCCPDLVIRGINDQPDEMALLTGARKRKYESDKSRSIGSALHIQNGWCQTEIRNEAPPGRNVHFQ